MWEDLNRELELLSTPFVDTNAVPSGKTNRLGDVKSVRGGRRVRGVKGARIVEGAGVRGVTSVRGEGM